MTYTANGAAAQEGQEREDDAQELAAVVAGGDEGLRLVDPALGVVLVDEGVLGGAHLAADDGGAELAAGDQRGERGAGARLTVEGARPVGEREDGRGAIARVLAPRGGVHTRLYAPGALPITRQAAAEGLQAQRPI